MQTTAIILAGGLSRRMGRDKAKLKINNLPLIKRIVKTLKPVFKNIIIVSKDVIPNCGPLSGIFTGLLYSKTKYNFIFAADMPFLNKKIIKKMIEKINGYDIIIPKTNYGYEPLHAIYSKACIVYIYNLLLANKLQILNLFPLVKTKAVSLNDLSFYNINTPADYKKALEILSKKYV